MPVLEILMLSTLPANAVRMCYNSGQGLFEMGIYYSTNSGGHKCTGVSNYILHTACSHIITLFIIKSWILDFGYVYQINTFICFMQGIFLRTQKCPLKKQALLINVFYTITHCAGSSPDLCWPSSKHATLLLLQ